jgi:hypothetical protein
MNTLAHGIVKRSQEEALLSTVIPNRRPFSAELDSRARALTSLLLVGFLTLASAVTLRAQQITGTLYGSVLDSQNAAIPGATVTATNVDTGLARTTQSNGQGEYRIEYLAVGNYSLQVTAPSFKSFIQQNVVLTVDQAMRVDATLTAGQASETVTVTSAPPLINTSTAEIGRTVQAEEMNNLPLVNRNVYTQLSLTPGVQSSSSAGANGASGNFVLGLPSQQTIINGGIDSGAGSVSYFLDGGINMTGSRFYGNPVPNPDALQEFRVETNNYDAQYGRFSSGVVTVLTRSGTNQFHGSLFEFVRNTDLNATPWGAHTNAPYHRNQFGGAVGGPIIPNRTFWFFSYGGLRQTTGTLLSGAIVPTALERVGNFSASAVKPIDPSTGQPYTYNGVPGWVPPSDLDPTAANIVNKYIPLPNAPGNQWVGYFVGPYDNNEFLGKVDHQLTPNNHLSVSYFNLHTTNNILGGGGNLLWSTQTDFARQQNVNVSDTQVFGGSLINQAWLTYTRIFGGRQNTPGISLGDLGSQYTIQGSPSLPQISVSGYFNLGQQIQGPTAGTNFYSFRDVASKTIGRQSLSIGGEMSLDKTIQLTDLDNYGIFSFLTSAPNSSKNALADFVLGHPASMTQQTPVEALTNSWYYAFFVQDNIRLTPRLTLNAGLRYDFQTPPTDPQNKELTFSPGVQSKVVPNAPLGVLFPGDPGVTRGIIGIRLHHISPRVGVAWDPFGDGKTSFRAAAGVFYGGIAGNEWNETSNGAPFAFGQNYSSIASLTNPYGNPASFPNGDPFPVYYNPANPYFPSAASIYGNSLNFQHPYSYQLNASMQRELPGDASFTIAYVGSLGHDIPFEPDVNYPAYAPGATTSQTSINNRRPYDTGLLGQISLQVSNQTTSYNALQVSFNKRFSRNFMLNGFYVWSNSFWSASPGVASSGNGQVQDYANLSEERGPADTDQRNAANISGVWNISYFRGSNKFIGEVLNGWQLAPVVSLNSGLPLNITTGADNNRDGFNSDRPNLTPGTSAFLSPHRSRSEAAAEWFNITAFTANGPGLGIGPYGTDGNTPRNYLRSPGYRDVDLGIFRNFHLWEQVNLQFRAEATNAFNLVSLSAPTASLSSANDGKITSATAPRQIQLGARLTF